MTKKDWLARLHVNLRLRCTYRWYAPNCDEVIVLTHVGTRMAEYRIEQTNRENAPRKHLRLDFPRAPHVRAIPGGFELLKEDGSLMSRYLWIEEEGVNAA